MSMSIEQLLQADAAKNHPGIPMPTIMKAFMAYKQNPAVTMIRQGNTILAFKRPKPDTASFHFINGDRAADFAKNVGILFGQMKKAGIKIAVAQFENPKILEVAKAQPYPYSIQQNHTPKGTQYTITVRF